MIRARQAGLTLVELLVAMAISLVVAAAAGYALLSGLQGFSSVDAASQVRDNGRFASEMITRLAQQAGFRDALHAATTRQAAGAGADPWPSVYAENDARPQPADPSRTFIAGGINGSDVLVLRHQAAETYPGSGRADPSIIDCSGASVPDTALPTGRDDVLAHVLYVDDLRGEPTLFCVTIYPDGTAGGVQPLVSGVETFQVLFGTDGVTPGAAPAPDPDSVADRTLNATQLSVPGDTPTTFANWRRVRNVRFGLVVRGPVAPVEDRSAQTFHPLGPLMQQASDAGSAFTPARGDRFRHAVTFTVHLRNDQGL